MLPGVEGWIGNFLVIVGTLAVLYPTTPQYQAEQKKKEVLQKTRPQTPRTPYPRMKTPRLELRPPRIDERDTLTERDCAELRNIVGSHR